MTTDELLSKLPKKIGRNPIKDKDGKTLAYVLDDMATPSIGWLYLANDGKDWCAYYGDGNEYTCMNPNDEAPYNTAIFYGSSPNEVLQQLYEWCIHNNFIK